MSDQVKNLVHVSNGTPTTDSLTIAKVFGKKHQHILRDIEALEIPEKVRQSNFGQSYYINAQNKKQPCYTITRDGFTILAMGFTGKKAMEFKLQYIEAFNQMESELRRRQASSQDLAAQILRLLKTQAAEIAELSVLKVFAPDLTKFGTTSERNGQIKQYVRRASIVAQKTATPFASLRLQPMLPGMSDEDCIAQLAATVPTGCELVIRPQE